MIRWFLGTLGVLLIFGGVFGAGVYVGNLQATSAAKDAANTLLKAEVENAMKAGDDKAAALLQAAAEKQALQQWMEANKARRIDISAALKRALDANDLSLCRYSDDIQRVRSRAIQEVRDAANDDHAGKARSG